MAATQVNSSNFDAEVIQSSIPVLVDFWAPWCGPCQSMGPVVEQLSDEYSGKVKVCKINVDENGELAEKYDVMSIPNFKLFKNGEIVNEALGAVGKEALTKLFNV